MAGPQPVHALPTHPTQSQLLGPHDGVAIRLSIQEREEGLGAVCRAYERKKEDQMCFVVVLEAGWRGDQDSLCQPLPPLSCTFEMFYIKTFKEISSVYRTTPEEVQLNSPPTPFQDITVTFTKEVSSTNTFPFYFLFPLIFSTYHYLPALSLKTRF